MNKKYWQVCELEAIVRSFIELSVAAVPQIWIKQLEDGSFICYWPKRNAGKKIRTFADPNNDAEGWRTFKCRVLMKGARYSRYEEAREAEQEAQDLSMTLDNTNTKEVNSTMDFDMSDNELPDESDESCDVYVAKQERSALVRDYYSTMDFDVTDHIDDDASDVSSHVSDDNTNGGITGNDTAKFNKAVLSHYSDNIPISAQECDSASTSYSSVESCYNYRFGSCNDFLTSTRVGDLNGVENTDSDALVLTIEGFQSQISSFYNHIKKELLEIKQILYRKSENGINVEGESIPNLTPNRIDNLVSDEIILVDDASLDKIPIHRNKNQLNQNWTPNPVNINLIPPNSIDEFVFADESEPNIPAITEEILENEKVLSDDFEDVRTPSFRVLINEEDDDLRPSDKTFTLPKQLKMKMDDMKEYRENEELLELEEQMMEDLVERLEPLHNEGEASYMKRTVNLLFGEDFFLDVITWKKEKNRQNIVYSNILKCWKKSFGTRFGSDEKNKRYMAHFRRMKSTKRAARKAAAERAAAEKAASEKAAVEKRMLKEQVPKKRLRLAK